MKISVVILTKNEEINIERCIKSLDCFDDVHVIDSNSTDGTVGLATENGAIVHYRKFDTFSGQRNFSHKDCGLKYDWVFHLDADEVMTDELLSALQVISDQPDHFDCFEIPSKLMFINKFLKYSSDFPVYQVRLLKVSMRFEEIGHGQKEICAIDRIGRIEAPYLHFNFSHGVAEWLTKHIGYAQKEAREISLSRSKIDFQSIKSHGYRRLMKSVFNNFPLFFRPFIKFFYLYFFKLGLLDGRAGLIFCTLQFIYELMIAIFYHLNRLDK